MGSQRVRHNWATFTFTFTLHRGTPSLGYLTIKLSLLNNNPICKTEKETQMYRTDSWTLWEKARVGCFERTASKHVYYQGWNRSPAQVGCMRQVLRPGALGRPRGIGWRGRCEGRSGWGTYVNPWLIHVNVWQNPLQYCKVISPQLIKINEKKKVIIVLSFLGCLFFFSFF